MKKLLSYLLVIALVLVQFIPLVNAEQGTSANTKGSITINNIPSNAPATKYDIYKILELESYDTTKGAYTYVVESTDESVTNSWYYFLTEGAGKDYVTLIASNNGKYVVTGLTKENAVAFTEDALEFAKSVSMTPTDTQTTAAGDKSITFTELELGYYLVDSSLGALIALNTTNKDVTIEEKNGVPVVDKGVLEDSDTTATYGDKNTADIGQTVYYQTTITAQAGAQNYKLYDKMDAGLTLNQNSIVIKKNETTLEKNTDYTVSFDTTGYTFVIDFDAELEYDLKDNDKLVVTYSAVVNEEAVIGSTGNVNETFLKYGDNNETTHDTTRTYTFKFDLIKKDNKNEALTGAEFELYNKNDEIIHLVEITEITGEGEAATTVITGYRVATKNDTNTTTKIRVGSTTIIGLDEDVYYLKETKAPEGYNKLTSNINVNLDATINSDNSSVVTINNTSSTTVNYANDTVTVINTTGTLLPSTGGMGTVLFVTVGSIMVLGFGVLLVTKLRISKMEI